MNTVRQPLFTKPAHYKIKTGITTGDSGVLLAALRHVAKLRVAERQLVCGMPLDAFHFERLLRVSELAPQLGLMVEHAIEDQQYYICLRVHQEVAPCTHELTVLRVHCMNILSELGHRLKLWPARVELLPWWLLTHVRRPTVGDILSMFPCAKPMIVASYTTDTMLFGPAVETGTAPPRHLMKNPLWFAPAFYTLDRLPTISLDYAEDIGYFWRALEIEIGHDNLMNALAAYYLQQFAATAKMLEPVLLGLAVYSLGFPQWPNSACEGADLDAVEIILTALLLDAVLRADRLGEVAVRANLQPTALGVLRELGLPSVVEHGLAEIPHRLPDFLERRWLQPMHKHRGPWVSVFDYVDLSILPPMVLAGTLLGLTPTEVLNKGS